MATDEYVPHPGGLGRSAHRLATELAKQGVDITVFTLPFGPRTPSEQPSCVDGVNVYTLASNLFEIRRVLAKADRVRKFDLFHALPLSAALPCLELAVQGKRPVLASIRGIDGIYFGPNELSALRDCSWITSVSRASLERAMQRVDISSRCTFIANGIDTARFSQWRPTAANAGVVGTVATFRRKKNIPLLIRSYAALSQAERRRLLLVGGFTSGDVDSEQPSTIEALIEQLSLHPEVTITGVVNNRDVPEYLLQMRVFVLSSDHEGLPNAVLEAAAAGVPVVATSVDGVNDVFTSGTNALLVPPGDPDALFAAIRRVLLDEPLALHLSENARGLAGSLTPEAERDAYLNLYARLLAQ